LIEVSASAIDFAVDPRIAPNIAPGISPSIDGQLDRETAVLVEDSQLLELPFTGIEFPTEDSAVVVVFSQHSSQHKPPDSASSETEPAAPAEDDSPRASLEALSRLHQDLTQEDLTQEVLIEESPALVVEAEPQSPTPTLATLTPATPTPGRATELLDIAIRMFPPSKPAPMEGVGLPSQSEALLPHLKSLPLRPKMAVAYGYVPPSTAPAQPKATAAGAQTIAPSKPAPVARPVARIIQPKQQPKQPPTPAKAPEPSKAAATFQPPSPAQPEADASVKAAEQPAKPVAEEAAKEIAKSAAKQPAQQTARQRPDERTQETAPSTVSGTVANTAPSTVSNTVPNFGAVQLANPSFIGSLKVKLGIAIALLVVACSTWLGWGGKSHKPGASSAISTDGSGPSIILGEGGWVEDWAGDPSGVHSGREITIYRPSLKLSDYRVEFQASIETQSIGWVFRAADPDNYYALKLMTVSSGLSPKVALFKYLVLNGRQTQVGRVPIDLAVQADTVFNIRTDVRGPQFSTYIQGQLVDVWTDDQLKAGGVGFLNEREERGKVKSVSIRYINGSAK
jgi:hypothetical protein